MCGSVLLCIINRISWQAERFFWVESTNSILNNWTTPEILFVLCETSRHDQNTFCQDRFCVPVTYLDNAEIDGRYLRSELVQFPPDERRGGFIKLMESRGRTNDTIVRRVMPKNVKLPDHREYGLRSTLKKPIWRDWYTEPIFDASGLH
jgi:hypothetical protein